MAERKKEGETSPRCLGSLGLQAGSERMACRRGLVVCGELDRELNDPCILALLAALEIGSPMLGWGWMTQSKPAPTTRTCKFF